MENNEIKQTVVAVRERERESKRIKKACSVCGAQNRTVVRKNRTENNTSVKFNKIGLGYRKIAECF